MMNLKDTLMNRDGISSDEADDLITEARQELDACLEEGDLETAEEICQDYFGLEPDFLMELM